MYIKTFKETKRNPRFKDLKQRNNRSTGDTSVSSYHAVSGCHWSPRRAGQPAGQPCPGATWSLAGARVGTRTSGPLAGVWAPCPPTSQSHQCLKWK